MTYTTALRISGKSQNIIELGHCVPSPPQNKNFVNTSKKIVKNRS